jgi:hypothetical protein
MATIKIKRGLKVNLPVLARGEMGYATDTNELFIGKLETPTSVNDNVLINDAKVLLDLITGGEAGTVEFEDIIDGGVYNTTYSDETDGGDAFQGRTDSGWWAATNVYFDNKEGSFAVNADNVQTALATRARVDHYQLTILDSEWTGEGPFIVEKTVNGIREFDTPIIDINLSNVDFEDVEDLLSSWSEVYKAETSFNKITFFAKNLPEQDLILQIKVVK